MKKENKNLQNRCDFCGKLTNFYFGELACFICSSCLGEYKKALTTVVKYNDWSTNKNIFTYIDKKTSIYG